MGLQRITDHFLEKMDMMLGKLNMVPVNDKSPLLVSNGMQSLLDVFTQRHVLETEDIDHPVNKLFFLFVETHR